MALPVKEAFIAARKKMYRLLPPLMQLAYALNEAGLTDEEIEGIADDPELLETVAKTVRDVVRGVPSPRIQFQRRKKDDRHEVPPPDIDLQEIADETERGKVPPPDAAA